MLKIQWNYLKYNRYILKTFKNTMELSGPRPLHLLKLPQKISVSSYFLLSFKIHKNHF